MKTVTIQTNINTNKSYNELIVTFNGSRHCNVTNSSLNRLLKVLSGATKKTFTVGKLKIVQYKIKS